MVTGERVAKKSGNFTYLLLTTHVAEHKGTKKGEMYKRLQTKIV